MANPDHPQAHAAGHGDNGNTSDARFSGRSRLEELLRRRPSWNKQALPDTAVDDAPAVRDTDDHETRTDRLAAQLSAQLEARNEEIQRLRHTVSRLENEKSRLDRAHRREVELHRAELESLQDAYNQFEKESDRLLAKLDRQNARLLDECSRRNVRSLLEN